MSRQLPIVVCGDVVAGDGRDAEVAGLGSFGEQEQERNVKVSVSLGRVG